MEVDVIFDLHNGVYQPQTGVPVESLAYTMTVGWDIGGNATPIGASTNIVGLAIAEKNNLSYTWKDYCKLGIPAVMITLAVVNIVVILLLA